MSSPVFRPAFRTDGTLDPECLERAGDRWLTGWLRDRLSGIDPWFPIDARYDEDPEALVIDVVRREGPDHPASVAISRTARTLLDEARAAAPELPRFFPSLLHLCRRVRLHVTASWFLEELAATARDPAAAERRWGSVDRVKEILFAGLEQAPGRLGPPAKESWERLLDVPSFATLGLLGLGSSLRQRMPYLARWWRACPEEDRRRELRYMVYQAVAKEGEAGVQDFLSESPFLPHDLKQALDQELAANGAKRFFEDLGKGKSRHNSHGGIFASAGWKREERAA